MTRKLFYEDPYLREFKASVVEIGVEENGTPYVVLDQTAFYPTGGGQPFDAGTLNGVEVIDVEEVDEQVRHRLASPLPEGTQEVAGEIDWARRFDHMQQHTGQHILSAAFEQLYDAETLGFHLGRETVTVDIALPDLTPDIIEQVEFLSNTVVLENRLVVARFVSKEELAQMPLRKAPGEYANIRIVTIEEFDYNPCGGTHPHRTGEVGPIKILSFERYKGNVRIQFVCGWRTIHAMSAKQEVLRQLSRQLTAGEAELPNSVDRLLKERKELEKSLAEARGKLLETEAVELLQAAEQRGPLRLVTQASEGRAMGDLQKMAQRITSLEPSAVVLLATSGEKTQLVFARGANVTVPMNDLLKGTLPLIEGKGGGQPAMAQGGGTGSASVEDVLAHTVKLLDEALATV